MYVFLNIPVSSPLDRSKRFTPPGRRVYSDTNSASPRSILATQQLQWNLDLCHLTDKVTSKIGSPFPSPKISFHSAKNRTLSPDNMVTFTLGSLLISSMGEVNNDVPLCCTLSFVDNGSSVGGMPDSQSREPGFESPLLPFRSLDIFFHFATPQSTQLYK